MLKPPRVTGPPFLTFLSPHPIPSDIFVTSCTKTVRHSLSLSMNRRVWVSKHNACCINSLLGNPIASAYALSIYTVCVSPIYPSNLSPRSRPARAIEAEGGRGVPLERVVKEGGACHPIPLFSQKLFPSLLSSIPTYVSQYLRNGPIRGFLDLLSLWYIYGY